MRWQSYKRLFTNGFGGVCHLPEDFVVSGARLHAGAAASASNRPDVWRQSGSQPGHAQFIVGEVVNIPGR